MDTDRAGDWEAVARFGSSQGVALTPDAIARIDGFLALLIRWNPRVRLTGERDPAVLLTKHVADSLACVPLLLRSAAVLDIGTGAGFPGLVIACARPDLHVTLVDSRERSMAFAREAIRTLGLAATGTRHLRAEDAAHDPAIAEQQDAIVSRAVRLDVVLGLAAPLLRVGGLCITMQTRHVSWETVATLATPAGLELVGALDYELPHGDPRRLIVSRRR